VSEAKMKHDMRRNVGGRINLADHYRPVALGAVRAAYSVAPPKNSPEPKRDAVERLLLPENVPD